VGENQMQNISNIFKFFKFHYRKASF